MPALSDARGQSIGQLSDGTDMLTACDTGRLQGSDVVVKIASLGYHVAKPTIL